MGYASLMMLPVLLGVLVLGVPVAFAMLAVALGFGLATFGPAASFQFAEKIEDVASNYVLAAIPLFVFMGCVLERSGVAKRVFEAILLWTHRVPGGLAITTILMAIVFAMTSGVVGATEAVIGLMAIPVMMRYRYNKELIVGTVCAGGTLGTIIPPSVIAVVLAPVADISVGDLLVGLVFPGFIMAGLFLLYVLILAILKPAVAPPTRSGPDTVPLAEKLRITLSSLAPPALLIVAVLGSIMMGIAAPTEAAAVGCMGALAIAMIYRSFSLRDLHEAVMQTLLITSMIMTIIFAGSMFTGVLVGAGGAGFVQDVVAQSSLSPFGIMCLALLLAFFAGFFLDWISVVLILVPIFAVVLRAVGVDMLWFCAAFLVVLQTSYLTPPLAPAIFYFRAISPPEITIVHMYRGVLPFVGLQLLTLVIVLAFPATVTWLPSVLFRGF